jgi:CMP-N,N'-diacetyllegionaminic acid synthase
MDTLIIIPARAGSKGLPGKNTSLLNGKPLISYTIDFALNIKGTNDKLCVTTNDINVMKIVNEYLGINLIERPDNLSDDSAGMTEVIEHTINFYRLQNIKFKNVLLLQPTSPIRLIDDYLNLTNLLDAEADMVVSVKESKTNPYFNLFEENKLGFLRKSKIGSFKCRQDCPKVFEYNGSMYLFKLDSFMNFGLHGMNNIRKMEMPLDRSIDIDDISDWKIAEFYLNN